MIIRRATIKDIPALADLWLAMMGEVYPEHTPNVEWWIQDRSEEVRSGIYMAYVAEDGGVIIGFTDALVYRDPSRSTIVAWSNHSYILPEHRHGAITSGLYQAIYAEARERGATVGLFCCTDELSEFWKRHGYTKIENIMTGVI